VIILHYNKVMGDVNWYPPRLCDPATAAFGVIILSWTAREKDLVQSGWVFASYRVFPHEAVQVAIPGPIAHRILLHPPSQRRRVIQIPEIIQPGNRIVAAALEVVRQGTVEPTLYGPVIIIRSCFSGSPSSQLISCFWSPEPI